MAHGAHDLILQLFQTLVASVWSFRHSCALNRNREIDRSKRQREVTTFRGSCKVIFELHLLMSRDRALGALSYKLYITLETLSKSILTVLPLLAVISAVCVVLEKQSERERRR